MAKTILQERDEHAAEIERLRAALTEIWKLNRPASADIYQQIILRIAGTALWPDNKA